MKKTKKQKLNFLSLIKKHRIVSGVIGIISIIVILFIGIFSWSIFSQNTYNLGGMMPETTSSMDFNTMESSKSIQDSGMRRNSQPIFNPRNDGLYDENIARKLVKRSNLSIIVRDIEISKQEILNLTRRYNGFVANSDFRTDDFVGNQGREYSRTSGQINIKIPSENFEVVLSELRKIALVIQRENIFINDVTEEFTDLTTRIKNKKIEEEQYRQILTKAKKIEDVLKTTQYLNKTRAEVERLEGRMNFLSNQIKLSDINIRISSEEDISIFGITWSPLYEVKQSFSNLIDDLKDFANGVIAFIFKLPILIIWLGIIYVILRYGWKGIQKAKKSILK